jgi:hypothetical protein
LSAYYAPGIVFGGEDTKDKDKYNFYLHESYKKEGGNE